MRMECRASTGTESITDSANQPVCPSVLLPPALSLSVSKLPFLIVGTHFTLGTAGSFAHRWTNPGSVSRGPGVSGGTGEAAQKNKQQYKCVRWVINEIMDRKSWILNWKESSPHLFLRNEGWGKTWHYWAFITSLKYPAACLLIYVEMLMSKSL